MEIGGGFGGKIPVYLEPIAAVLSKKSRRPVQLVMSRTDVFDASGPAPGGKVIVKIGVDKNGKMLAGYADIRLEAGGYPEAFIEAAAKCVFSCYDIPSMDIEAYDVLVNKPSSAPYRAPGSPQVAFATETVVDEICKKLDMDLIDFRLLNVAEKGTRTALGPKYRKIGLKEVLEAAKKAKNIEDKPLALVSTLPENIPEHVSFELLESNIITLHGLDTALAASSASASNQTRVDPKPIFLSNPTGKSTLIDEYMA